VAIVMGHVARAQIRRTGEHGGGFAIAGLVLGYVGLVVGLVLLAIGVITTLIIASARSQGLAR
jgi:hypothetical protein